MEIVKHGIVWGLVDNDENDVLELEASRLSLSNEEAERRGYRCECVTNHNPNPQEFHWHHVWPLGDGGPDVKENLILVCPTAHANIHVLLREYKKYRGLPPYSVTKYFSSHARKYAGIAWDQIFANQKPAQVDNEYEEAFFDEGQYQ